LHRQLQQAADYAHQNGIVLKGDIPIGVNRFSADVWQHPDLFHTEMQAGAPPDAFAAKGQNWGFPTYNWPRMQQDHYAWWRRRFEQMARYFDAFRIDHILGFFRIWSIPWPAVEGILGYFVPAVPLTEAEFLSRGIRFDRDRLLRPYITPALLDQMFEEYAVAARDRFFDQLDSGRLCFKPEFATQRQVAQYFAETTPDPANAKLQLLLFDLHSNVILLKESDQRFHFRLGMENTPSFLALDAHTQSQLRDLYLDYFFRRQDRFWAASALEKLPELKRATNMLVCGEDLGMVPACVPHVMRQLGLLGLEVQRMPKDLRRAFSRPAEAPYLSVVTPSTHDMSTLRGWWREDPALTQQFFNTELGLPGPAPAECEPWVSRAIIRQHLASPAMWSIFQIQDLFGIDEALRRKDVDAERINVPANPAYYWRYRMHLTLEQLLRQDGFNQALLVLLQEQGR
ncbi:MAG TPA: 4-alpha-glucanotransferase, partial [Clostridia bacterium]|nr:4-alpha-glucanotransferase [Clostridia bacterium]